MYKTLLKPLLFLLPAEKAHHFTFRYLKLVTLIPGLKSVLRRLYTVEAPELRQHLFGIDFKNPIGLAAGFDKDAKRFNELFAFGFGFIEIGTITPKAQPGNPLPRLFRLTDDNALINRMGFNNEGLEGALKRLKGRNKDIIIGGNIGKNKVTPNEHAGDDYELCFEALFPHVDYFVVNVSSPNTPDLRALQEKAPLTALLKRLSELNSKKKSPKPILLKIAPDLNNTQLDDIIEIVQNCEVSGIIATNTTIDRGGLKTSADAVLNIGDGGLSGKPLTKRSTEVIRYVVQKSNGSIPVIGVGGIHTAEDAIEKLEAGASLLQVYTGFIYEGPAMVRKLNKGILNHYKRRQSKIS